MRPAALASLSALAAATFVMMASCSLGLDESLADRADAEGMPDGSTPDVDVTDAGSADGAADGAPREAPCTKDEDCVTADACLKSRCDLARSRCVYDVCTTTACTVQACDEVARTCGAPTTHGFKAAQFPVGAGVGCDGSAARCFAVVYPYVFVGTVNGVVAFRASDPTATAPTPVPVTGLSFIPTRLLSSGNRVYFLGAAGGVGTTSRLPLAWIDVPVDPFAKTLAVTGVLASVNRPTTADLELFARDKSRALVVDLQAASNFATALVEPPLVEPISLTTEPIPNATGSSPVAVTGTRYLMLSPPPNSGVPTFGFIENLGTANAKSTAEAALPSVAPVSASSQAFAASQNGAVLWVNALLSQPISSGPSYISRARAHFLVADAASGVDATAAVEIDTYPPSTLGPGASVIGPAAMLDPGLALVTTMVRGTPQQTNVSFVDRKSLGLVKNVDGSPRRSAILATVSALGASASNGIGYVLAVESATAATVFVYDPGCPTP